MENVFKSKKLKSLVPYLIIGLTIVLAHRVISEIGFFVGVVNNIWLTLSPFFYGFILAYIISMPCNAIQRLIVKTNVRWIVKKKKMISIILVFLIMLLIIALVLNLIIPVIVSSISLFIYHFPAYYASAREFFETFTGFDFLGLSISFDMILHTIGEAVQGFSIEDLQSPIDAFVNVGMAMFRGLLALISSVYILHEKEKFKIYISRALKALLSVRIHNAVTKYVAKLNQNFKQYIYTQTIDGLILGFIATVALYIIGSPFFLLLGLILGFLNYVPYFGSIVGTLIAIVTVMFTQGFTMGLITTGVLFVIQQIDANIIQPKLMSGSFSLSPFLVIVSITVGGAIAGVLGMIAAIPIAAILGDISENIINYFEKQKQPSESQDGSAESR